VDDCIERSGGAGLFRHSPDLSDTRQITDENASSSRNNFHCVLGAFARMQYDFMARGNKPSGDHLAEAI
jgi:hypothetical protein